MQTKIELIYHPTGRLEKANSKDDVVFQGSVATSEFYLKMAEDVANEDAWLPTDSVFICFKRPDNQKSAPLLMQYENGYWKYISNGWLEDVDLGGNASSYTVNVLMRRYSNLNKSTIVATRTSEQIKLPISPSIGWSPQNISNDAYDEVLKVVSGQNDTVEKISNFQVGTVNTISIEADKNAKIEANIISDESDNAYKLNMDFAIPRGEQALQYISSNPLAVNNSSFATNIPLNAFSRAPHLFEKFWAMGYNASEPSQETPNVYMWEFEIREIGNSSYNAFRHLGSNNQLSADFGAPTASVTSLSNDEAPTVSVSASGNRTAKVFNFQFGIPKGDTGKDGKTINIISGLTFAGDSMGIGRLLPLSYFKYPIEVGDTVILIQTSSKTKDTYIGTSTVEEIVSSTSQVQVRLSYSEDDFQQISGERGNDGLNGFSIYHSTNVFNRTSTSQPIEGIDIPDGRALQKGDLIIDNSTCLYKVNSTPNSTATYVYASFIYSLEGNSIYYSRSSYPETATMIDIATMQGRYTTVKAGDLVSCINGNIFVITGANNNYAFVTYLTCYRGNSIYYLNFSYGTEETYFPRPLISPTGKDFAAGDIIIDSAGYLFSVTQFTGTSTDLVPISYTGISIKGDTGATPNVSATASVDANIGTPSVQVSKSGTNEAPAFQFAFKNLKGANGIQGNGYYRALEPLTSSTTSVARNSISPENKPLLLSDTIVDNNGLVFAVTANTAASATTVPISYRGSIKGATGAKGATGQRGTQWYSGTAITGTSTTATVFSSSGISSAIVDDMYLNTSTYNIYKCTTAGNAAAAKWVYVCNIKGATGATGATGPAGTAGAKGATGTRGSVWNTGTAITGTSTTATIFSGSGLTSSLVNDMYLNTSTYNVYKCTTAGAAAAAKWVYVCNIKGASTSNNNLPLTGGTMTGTINSSKTTSSYLAGNQGQAIINSTAAEGAYTMLDKLNSKNGYFTDGVFQGKRLFQYTDKSTVTAGTNAVTKSVTLLDENGDAVFPNYVTAKHFIGTIKPTLLYKATGTISTGQKTLINNNKFSNFEIIYCVSNPRGAYGLESVVIPIAILTGGYTTIILGSSSRTSIDYVDDTTFNIISVASNTTDFYLYGI